MAQFDAEDLLSEIRAIMTAGLNAKIAEIETEKGALTPTLAAVGANSYFEQTWNEKILNKNPAIFYGIEDVQAVENGGGLAKTYKLFVEVVLVDNGQRNDTSKRILRYSRALEELFQAADLAGRGMSKLKVDTVRPVAFKLELDSSEEIKIGGVTLTTTIV